jgi:hypothetical protein
MERISILVEDRIMSENLHIGLSREQINKLLMGDEVGKRPYDIETSYADGETRYNDTIRIWVKLLSEEEKAKEPDSAFSF